jgi:anti-sigma factor RsiW
MTCTPRRIVEAYALGELDDAAAADVRAHLEGCARCAGEADRLAAERELFARRAALPAPPPPSFTAVLARARREERRAGRPRRVRLWSMLAAAAALVLAVEVAGREPAAAPVDEAAAIVAEPAPRGESCQDPRVIANEAATREEHAYGACLSGTPNCPAEALAPHEAEHDEDGSCSVTCDACGSHPGEVLETGTRGECAP